MRMRTELEQEKAKPPHIVKLRYPEGASSLSFPSTPSITLQNSHSFARLKCLPISSCHSGVSVCAHVKLQASLCRICFFARSFRLSNFLFSLFSFALFSLSHSCRCHARYYCSSSCQASHWSTHKRECSALRAENHASFPVDSLPTELLGIVCSFLDIHSRIRGAARVSRAWRDAVGHPLVWSSTQLLKLEQR